MDLIQLTVLVGLLILVNAAFAGAEMALVSLNEGQLHRLDRQGRAGRAAARLARAPNRYLATVQIGITLAGFLASAAASVSLAERVTPALDDFGSGARPLTVFIITAPLTLVTLVCGELVPKRLAMEHAERWALTTVFPLTGLAILATPIVGALSRATDLIVGMLGGQPKHHRGELSPQDLRDLVDAQQAISPLQRRIVAGAIEAGGRSLHEIVRPRGEVFSLITGTTTGDARAALARAGHHRAPVYEPPTLDRLVGVAHLIDLVPLAGGEALDHHVRDALVLPESVSVLTALRRAQHDRQQMILVADEYGGIEGIVTVEDLVEEFVGEIFDQYDRDVLSVQERDGGAFELVGGYPIHDLPHVGIELPEGDYATVGGLIAATLGRIPRVGDEVSIGDWRLRVLEVRDHAPARVRVERARGAGTD